MFNSIQSFQPNNPLLLFVQVVKTVMAPTCGLLSRFNLRPASILSFSEYYKHTHINTSWLHVRVGLRSSGEGQQT